MIQLVMDYYSQLSVTVQKRIGTPTQSFNFLHLEMQEYFAAKYVTTLPEDEVYTLLKESFAVNNKWGINPDSKSVRLSNMWILYCGITSGQCKTLRHYLTTYGKPDYYTLLTTFTTRSTDLQIASENMTDLYQQKTDQRISHTGIISQDILKDPLKVLYLFQCFQEAQDNVLCEVLSQSFHGVIDISYHSLLPHQVVSLGFFLSRSHRKLKELNLCNSHFGDHSMGILHQYLCGDKANKQEITKINFSKTGLTAASSHLIADIINHLQLQTLVLEDNNITNVRDISTAVITSSTVKVLDMRGNGLTTQDVSAMSDMMICLEELFISNNRLGYHGAELLSEGITNTKTLRVLHISNNNLGDDGAELILLSEGIKTLRVLNISNNNLDDRGAELLSEGIKTLRVLNISNNNLGDHGAKSLSEGITNTKTLRVFDITINNIGPSGTTAIANALSNNTTLEELYMYDDNFIGQDAAKALMYDDNFIGQDAAKALCSAIINNKTLKKLSLGDELAAYPIDKESAMIIIRSLYNNNTITELSLYITLCKDDITMVTKEVERINSMRKSHNKHVIDFMLWFTYQLGGRICYTTTKGLSPWRSYSYIQLY